MSGHETSKIIKNLKLEKFCESTLKSYKSSLKESFTQSDFEKLKSSCLLLANDCDKIDASDIARLSREIASIAAEVEVDRSVLEKNLNSVLCSLELLEKDYKDYINTVYTTKKINVLTTLRCLEDFDTTEDSGNEFEIDKEMNMDWKCLVF